jgi:hypothetical protein
MPEIISFAARKRQRLAHNVPIIEKIVDGQIVECVNLDGLSPSQLSAYFAAAERECVKGS